jgi:hypothetical protein
MCIFPLCGSELFLVEYVCETCGCEVLTFYEHHFEVLEV